MNYIEEIKEEIRILDNFIIKNTETLNSDILQDDKLYIGLQIGCMKKYKEYLIKRLSLYGREYVCSLSNSYDTALNDCFK